MGLGSKVVLLASYLALLVITSADDPKFRCDYKYYKKADVFLKYHDIPANWLDARLRCHLEGAYLASPVTKEMAEAIWKINKDNNTPYDITWHIYTGIHATFSRGDFNAVEGEPLNDLYFKWQPTQPDSIDDDEQCLIMSRGTGLIGDEHCWKVHPYICAKPNVNITINECGTSDPDYQLDSTTGSCYKFHRVPRLFSDAYRACAAEGGYLAIINNDYESGVLRKLCEANPASSMPGNFDKDIIFIGFHDWGQHGEWLTIHGETLDQVGFQKWSLGEPNNFTVNIPPGEFCGSIKRDGLLNDIICEKVHPFICEKDPSSLVKPCDVNHHRNFH